MLRRLNLFRCFLPCCLLGLLLLGLGGKLWLIFNYGTPIPDRAQWQAIIPSLVPEWAAGNVVLGPANESAGFPLLARAVLGAIVHANHQWDDRVTTVFNAVLLVGTFALLLAAAARRLGWTALWAAALCSAILLALPLGWEESLAGSALPDRLALFLAFPALWVLFDRTLQSPIWWLGAVSVVVAHTAAEWIVVVDFTLAVVAVVRLFGSATRRWRDLVVLTLGFLGFGLHRWFYPGCWSGLHWPDTGDLGSALSHPQPVFALLLLGPLAVRLVTGARDGDRKHSLAPFAALSLAALALIVWVVAAGPRRHGSPAAAQDVLTLLLALGFGTLTQLWHLRWQALPVRLGLTVAWFTLLFLGLQVRLERAMGLELPALTARHERELAGFQRLLAPGQPDASAAAYSDVYYAAGALAAPALRPVLPHVLQSPVPLERGPATTPDFLPLARDRFSLPAPDEPAWAGGPTAEAEGGTLFISLPLPPTRTSVLRFRIAGDLGTPRFPFVLRSTRTGDIVPLQFDRSTGERWRTANLVRPADPVVIVAGPAALGTWGAFTHPVEMGLWSWYAAKLAKNWAWVVGAGVLFFSVALLLPLAPRSPRRETFSLDRDGRIRVAHEDDL